MPPLSGSHGDAIFSGDDARPAPRPATLDDESARGPPWRGRRWWHRRRQCGGASGQDEVGIATKTRAKPKKPSQFKVLMLNDDYTPMEFVVMVLKRFFHMDLEQATRVMLHVHQTGVGVCGIFPYEIAETKVNQVMDFARAEPAPAAMHAREGLSPVLGAGQPTRRSEQRPISPGHRDGGSAPEPDPRHPAHDRRPPAEARQRADSTGRQGSPAPTGEASAARQEHRSKPGAGRAGRELAAEAIAAWAGRALRHQHRPSSSRACAPALPARFERIRDLLERALAADPRSM